MPRLFGWLWICLLSLASVSGCSALPRLKHPHREVESVPIARWMDLQGNEEILEIPGKGLSLGEIIRRFAQEPIVSARQVSSAPHSIDPLAKTLEGLDAQSKNLATALQESEYDVEDPQVQQLIGLMTKKLGASGSVDNPQEWIRRYTDRLVSDREFRVFSEFAAESSLSNMKQMITEEQAAPEVWVCVTRAQGEQLVMPMDQALQTALSSIMVNHRDTVSIHPRTFFENTSSADRARVVISGMSTSAGRSVEVARASRLKQLHSEHASPYADIAILTRVSPIGALRHHMLPIAPDGSDAVDLGVEDGDLVQFTNIELLPVVVGSRLQSRQRQIESIQKRERHH